LPRDEKAVAAALGPAKDAAKLPEPSAFRVLTALRFDNGRRSASEVVILLAGAGGEDGAKGKDQNALKDDGKDPFSILSWQDQVETGGRPLAQAGR
jgi:hypothetical protein